MLVRVSTQSLAAPGSIFTWTACPPRLGVQVQRGSRAVPRPCQDSGVDHLLEKLSCYLVTDRSHTQRKRKAREDVNDTLHKLGCVICTTDLILHTPFECPEIVYQKLIKENTVSHVSTKTHQENVQEKFNCWKF